MKSQDVIKYYDYDVLDNIVWNIRYEKFDAPSSAKNFVENESAVQPVSNKITGYIAEIKCNIVVWNDECIKP